MSIETLSSPGVPIKVWSNISDVEFGALTQLKNIASLPWVFKHIAVMPDVLLRSSET